MNQPDVQEAMQQAVDEAPEALQEPLEVVIGKLQAWGEQVIGMLPNLIVAVVVLVLFWLLSKAVASASRRVYMRTTGNPSLAHLMTMFTRFGVLAAGFIVALGVLQLDKTVTSLLAGAGVLGLALGFALQDIAVNLLSGTMISVRKPFIAGDVIESHGHFGTVTEINMRTTNVRTPQGQMILIPNKEIFENAIINFTNSGKVGAHLRRVDLSVGISYGEKLEKVEQVTIAAVEGIEARLQDREVELFFLEFGDSSINFVVRFWIEFHRPIHYNAAVSQAIKAIKAAYDDNDIMIPFPIRTLDFGIKGGRMLDQVLAARSSDSLGES